MEKGNIAGKGKKNVGRDVLGTAAPKTFPWGRWCLVAGRAGGRAEVHLVLMMERDLRARASHWSVSVSISWRSCSHCSRFWGPSNPATCSTQRVLHNVYHTTLQHVPHNPTPCTTPCIPHTPTPCTTPCVPYNPAK